MSGQDARAKAEWTRIHHAVRNPYDMDRLLEVDRDNLSQVLGDLEASSGDGITDFKRRAINPVFSLLDNARYRGIDNGSITRQLTYLTSAVYVIGIQRGICEGEFRIRSRPQKPQAGQTTGTGPAPQTQSDPASLDLRAIMADLTNLVNEDPGIRSRQEFKTLVNAVQKYREELATLQKLVASAPRSRDAYVESFRTNVAELTERIARAHHALVAPPEAEETDTRPPLVRVPLTELTPVLNSQLRQLARVRGSLLFVLEEQQDVRETLVALADSRDAVFATITEEDHAFPRLLSGASDDFFPTDQALSRALAAETAIHVQRVGLE